MIVDEERIAKTMVIDGRLPADSAARKLKIWENRILIRPYQPEGKTDSGLWITRNDKHPKIWGHILAVPKRTHTQFTDIVPGAMIVYARFADETLGWDTPKEQFYLGEMLEVAILHIDSIHCVISPPLVALRV